MTWDPFEQAPHDAINWFRDRVPVTVSEWSTLSQDARRRAFFISGTSQLDLIGDVHKSLLKALDEGKSFAEWKKEMRPRLEAAWKASGQGPTTTAQINNRMGTIFQNNIQSAYQAGRFRQMTDPDVLKERPIWVYVSVMDDRTSDRCRKLNGTTLPHDDPFWVKNHPPRHPRCRSSIRSIPAGDAQLKAAPAGVQAEPGWGTMPKPGEWATEMSKGVGQGAAAAQWTPAWNGNAPTAVKGYGLPAQLPARPLPKPQATPASRQMMSDPLDTVLLYNPEIAPLPAGVSSEVLQETLENPAEIWLMPMQSNKGTVVYRQRHISSYQDGDETLLVIVESHRGVVIGVQVLPAEKSEEVRQGFVRHQKKNK
ncbi:phage minor head protein [Deinococcus cellulosilyticus]|uniref:Uncharacterized protein n=1 Tax=Deinococcus cellulosilyticus (strain DSM 18568 / NBRC 106333 / KACC 11606 / 5516J-15) TaxID=1223518 RepID=A0A511NBY8_DEIC1|nr:phage minor head protein [Deinococcus cellulosilyticus]GEM50018.1 hypothetical protein DC3_56530 [Deinococcus cellulosilyticus NBRC 106333 = KACC 11606]